MKRLTVIIIAVCAVLCASAQQDSTRQFRYGYLSYDSVLVAMPGYALVQNTLAAMRSQYETEMKRVEQDFNLKYEEFLDGQRDFPPTILRKRQTELKELLERNVSFKAVSRQELAEAEVRAMAPLRERLSQTLDQIGRERGYAFILNTDAGAVPFINPAVGEDITQLVLNALR